MKKLNLIFTILFLSSVIIGCNIFDKQDNVTDDYISKNDFLLDTIVEIKIYQPDQDSEEIIQKAFDRIKELEEMLSVHLEGSDLYNIKENAGVKPVEVSEESYYVIDKSLEYSEMTDGKFDITIGPLVDLWDIDPPEGHVPTDEELSNALSKIDYKKVLLNDEDRTVMLADEEMIANLGAIAKGYIADEVKKLLVENGVQHGIINLGGNVLLIGDKPDGTDYKIGIQDPNSDRGAYLGLVNIKDMSVVSSGDYERYFEKDGKKYHHILDPTTGYPSDNELTQVTILSEQSIDGDGLSTSSFLLGLEEGFNLIEKLDGVEAIFITKDGKIYLTSGAKELFQFDESYSDRYEVVD